MNEKSEKSSLQGWTEVIERCSERSRQEVEEWRKANPPEREVQTVLGGEPVTFGLWKGVEPFGEEDKDLTSGVYFSVKQKDGYHPNRTTFLPTALVEALFGLVEGG